LGLKVEKFLLTGKIHVTLADALCPVFAKRFTNLAHFVGGPDQIFKGVANYDVVEFIPTMAAKEFESIKNCI